MVVNSLHKLNRTEQVILFRFRTGHNRLNAHMYNKFNVGEPEMCPCNADIMTAEHLLQHCPLHDVMRRDTWPDPMLLRDKLYGNLEELRRTAAFVRITGISPSYDDEEVVVKETAALIAGAAAEVLYWAILLQWDPLIRSSLTVNPPYKKAKNLVPSKVFFVMTYESSDIRISLIRNPPYKNVNFWSHRGR